MLKLIPIEQLYTVSNVRNGKDDEIFELAQSIRERGLLEPLVVKAKSVRGYEIIAGHRRYEALKLACEPMVECNVLEDVDKTDTVILQVIENTQRKEMSAYELCQVFDELRDKKGYSLKQIASAFSKNETWVRNNYAARRILENEFQGESIPEEKKKLSYGVIRAGHKRKTQGEKKTTSYNGFTVTQCGHSYMIYMNNYDAEQALHEFFEGWK